MQAAPLDLDEQGKQFRRRLPRDARETLRLYNERVVRQTIEITRDVIRLVNRAIDFCRHDR